MMLSTILWGTIIVGGSIAYGMLGGEYKESTPKASVSDDNSKVNYDKTYDYIKSLSYDEINDYIESNYKLSNYKGYIESNCNMGDKAQIARCIADISRYESRAFDNRNSRY